MEIRIENHLASLEIHIGVDSRTVSKSLVREISLVRDNLLKIDIGGGLSGNIYLPIVDIISPAYTDGNELCAQLNDYLTQAPQQLSTQLTETYTLLGDVKQDGNDILALLGGIQQQVSDINTMLNDVRLEALLQVPLIRDESNLSKIYCGYAPLGTPQSSPNWAILKIFSQANILSYQWADGDRNFDNVWADRAILDYQ